MAGRVGVPEAKGEQRIEGGAVFAEKLLHRDALAVRRTKQIRRGVLVKREVAFELEGGKFHPSDQYVIWLRRLQDGFQAEEEIGPFRAAMAHEIGGLAPVTMAETDHRVLPFPG